MPQRSWLIYELRHLRHTFAQQGILARHVSVWARYTQDANISGRSYASMGAGRGKMKKMPQVMMAS